MCQTQTATSTAAPTSAMADPTNPSNPENPYMSASTNPFYQSVIAKLQQQQVPPSYSTGFPTMQQILMGGGG